MEYPDFKSKIKRCGHYTVLLGKPFSVFIRGRVVVYDGELAYMMTSNDNKRGLKEELLFLFKQNKISYNRHLVYPVIAISEQIKYYTTNLPLIPREILDDCEKGDIDELIIAFIPHRNQPVVNSSNEIILNVSILESLRNSVDVALKNEDYETANILSNKILALIKEEIKNDLKDKTDHPSPPAPSSLSTKFDALLLEAITDATNWESYLSQEEKKTLTYDEARKKVANRIFKHTKNKLK